MKITNAQALLALAVLFVVAQIVWWATAHGII
jgi:hypothetical protein